MSYTRFNIVNNKKLKTIILPSIEQFHESAFCDNCNLEFLILPNKNPNFNLMRYGDNDKLFLSESLNEDLIPEKLFIYVPESLINNYKQIFPKYLDRIVSIENS